MAEAKKDLIEIEFNKKNYYLKIDNKEEKITFKLIDEEKISSINYIRTMNFEEIKKLNHQFSLLKSFDDFYDYLHLLAKNKKLSIKKSKEEISIIILADSLSKQEIKIDLYPDKTNKEKSKDLDDLKSQNQKSKNNNPFYVILFIAFIFSILFIYISRQLRELNKTVESRKEKMISIKENLLKSMLNSLIIKDDEKNMIFREIENKMNKKIKEIKKLYQATKDGGDPINFHSKCDNIPNTLVLIKSEGNRRFGGFTPIPWKSEIEPVLIADTENKTFIFSLDNNKIYYLKESNKALLHYKEFGPCFGSGSDIGIEGNPIKENKLYTYQSSYDYKGDNKDSLSEYDFPNLFKAIEYEVFKVIFD